MGVSQHTKSAHSGSNSIKHIDGDMHIAWSRCAAKKGCTSGIWIFWPDTALVRRRSQITDGYHNQLFSEYAKKPLIRTNALKSKTFVRTNGFRLSALSPALSLGCGTRIRTQTNRVRVCRATFTQFRNDSYYYNPNHKNVKMFFKISYFFFYR